MLPALGDFLTLRLPSDIRAALDGEARAADMNVSVVARRALAAGLDQIRVQASADMPAPRTLSAAPAQAVA